MHGEREHEEQPNPRSAPEEKSGQRGHCQRGAQVVEEDVVVAVERFAASQQREAVEVGGGPGQGDGSALALVELAPMREPPAVLEMSDRAQRSLRSIDVPRIITDDCWPGGRKNSTRVFYAGKFKILASSSREFER